jgi:hypothetical protein
VSLKTVESNVTMTALLGDVTIAAVGPSEKTLCAVFCTTQSITLSAAKSAVTLVLTDSCHERIV